MAMLEKIKEYGQNLFLEAQATNGSSNKEKAALQDIARLMRDGFVKLMIKHNLDALLTQSFRTCIDTYKSLGLIMLVCGDIFMNYNSTMATI